MGMQIDLTKSEETIKMKNEEKTQKLKKIENEEKVNLILEKVAKIDINDLHNKLGHPAEEMVNLTGNYMKLLIRGIIVKIALLEKCNRKTMRKDRKKNHQNGDFVFTSTLHYQNLLVLEDQNIGFWQWMRPHM